MPSHLFKYYAFISLTFILGAFIYVSAYEYLYFKIFEDGNKYSGKILRVSEIVIKKRRVLNKKELRIDVGFKVGAEEVKSSYEKGASYVVPDDAVVAVQVGKYGNAYYCMEFSDFIIYKNSLWYFKIISFSIMLVLIVIIFK